jgi:hypothetical protein
MLGNELEIKTLINSSVPDAVDMLNVGDGRALAKYKYLVDLTGEADFAEKRENVITPDEVSKKLSELLPAWVDGGLHWFLNERDGGYYITVFNNSGVMRSPSFDEHVLDEETRTVSIDTKGKPLTNLEGGGVLEHRDGKYYLTLRGGAFFFGSF